MDKVRIIREALEAAQDQLSAIYDYYSEPDGDIDDALEKIANALDLVTERKETTNHNEENRKA